MNQLPRIVATTIAACVCFTGCRTMPPLPALPGSAARTERAAATQVQNKTAAPSASAAAQSNRANQASATNAPDPASIPKTIVAIWSDATMRLPGKPATRGLGGRLYFYNDRQEAIPTNGQLIVYGYDDTLDGTQKTAPDRKYVITPEEFPRHFGESEIGPSYSVWIPWDQVGDPQRSVSVLPSFTTTTGQLVMGELARHVLPGPKPLQSLQDNRPSSQQTTRFAPQITGPGSNGTNNLVGHNTQIALASHAEPLGTAYAPSGLQQTEPETMRSVSIKLPPSVKDRLAQSTPIQQTVTTGGVTQNIVQGNRPFSAMSQTEIAQVAANLMQRAKSTAVKGTPASAIPLPPAAASQWSHPANQTNPTDQMNQMAPANSGLPPSAHSVPDTRLVPNGPIAPRGLGLPPSERNLSAPPVHSASSPGRSRVRPSIFPAAAALPVTSPIAGRGY